MGSPTGGSPIFFPSPAAFRSWLESEHESAEELWVGYHKKATGSPRLATLISDSEAGLRIKELRP